MSESRPMCGAKLRNGGTCHRRPMKAQTRCYMHGGKTPVKLAAARRRLAEDSVRRSLEKVEIREVENPLAELQALTSEVVAWKDALASHVAALGEAYRRQDEKGGEQLRAEVELYERALDRAGKFLEMWARLGLDSMLAALKVRVSEQQTEAMVRAVNAGLAALDLDEASRQTFLTVVAKRLRS